MASRQWPRGSSVKFEPEVDAGVADLICRGPIPIDLARSLAGWRSRTSGGQMTSSIPSIIPVPGTGCLMSAPGLAGERLKIPDRAEHGAAPRESGWPDRSNKDQGLLPISDRRAVGTDRQTCGRSDVAARTRRRLWRQPVLVEPRPPLEQLRGFDIAPNGIEAGRQIANYFKLDDRVSFDRIDLTDAAIRISANWREAPFSRISVSSRFPTPWKR